jgi:hypothetical protein
MLQCGNCCNSTQSKAEAYPHLALGEEFWALLNAIMICPQPPNFGGSQRLKVPQN